MFTVNENLPDRLYSAAQVRELDSIAIQELNIPAYTLMQRAATFGYDCLIRQWPQAKSITVVCGSGNNAGDAYVLARLAADDNKNVNIINLFAPEKLTGAAATAYRDLLTAAVKPQMYCGALLDETDVIVDGLFGTGLDRNIEGDCYAVIQAINASARPVLSLDIPSGIHADTGTMMNIAVQAEQTATFIGLKQGLFTHDGLQCSGVIKFNNLGVPGEAYTGPARQSVSRLRLSELNRVLSPRKKNTHKGHYGHVLIIGGDAGYLGAARMAAEAAARVGAGLVSVATRTAHASQLSSVRPEIMSHAVETLDALMPLIERADVIAIGPGLGHSAWAKTLFARVLESRLPLVIDADGLAQLADESLASTNWVLTPHPGEAASLLKSTTAAIQSNRFAAAMKLHEKYSGPVVLKGCGTIIVDSTGQRFVCDSGNPGMASGGMGDVLTGVIAGLIAQKIAVDHATKLGVCLHAVAADLAAGVSGERGLMAMDLMPQLRQLVNPEPCR